MAIGGKLVKITVAPPVPITLVHEVGFVRMDARPDGRALNVKKVCVIS